MRLLLILLLLTLAGCHRDPGPNPQLKFELYELGWQRGFNDQLIPNKPDWQRFRPMIEDYKTVPDRDTIFATGYADGYSQHPEVPRDEDELTYDFAFRHGRSDAWARQPPTSTANAYLDGYQQRPHRFKRPY